MQTPVLDDTVKAFCFSYAGIIHYFKVDDESKFRISKFFLNREEFGNSYRVRYNEKKELEGYFYNSFSTKEKVDKKFAHMKIPVVEKGNIKTLNEVHYFWAPLSNLEESTIAEIRTLNQYSGEFRMCANFYIPDPLSFILTIKSNDAMVISLTNDSSLPLFDHERLEFKMAAKNREFVGKTSLFTLSVNFSALNPIVSLFNAKTTLTVKSDLFLQTKRIEEQLDLCRIELF